MVVAIRNGRVVGDLILFDIVRYCSVVLHLLGKLEIGTIARVGM